MSVSACPLKENTGVEQLLTNPHRPSFCRVQSGASLATKTFTPHSNNTPYSAYRGKPSPTIVDSFSLTQPASVPKASQLPFHPPPIGTTLPDPVSDISNSAYRNMEYSTLPAPFNPSIPYMTREHAHDLKTASTLPYHDSRSDGDYMRVDFNPIVESLNFAATGSGYDTLPNNSFATWPNAETMDVDGEMKSRLDFRTQLLGQGNSISRLADDFRAAEQLYVTTNNNNNTNRRNPTAFAATSGRLCELNHFSLLGPQRDPGPNCLSQFDANGYPQADKPGISAGLVNGMSSNVNGSGRMSTSTMLPPRSSTQCQPTSTQALAVSANADNSMVSSVMMTPDSSTTGFMTSKFTGSSDDGEVSPTPTNSSGRPHTPGRMRKAAPTLATGRRNLKGELVDPDEADRRMKRRERNRKSAQKCRERKVQRTQELQAQVECLQLEINRLTQERDSLRNEARQFVTLLQLHCPGVAIPYMSCLNETLDGVGNTTTTTTTTTNDSLQSSAVKTANGHGTGAPNGWKSKANGKSVPEAQQTVAPVHTHSFSPLPTMVSLHSHMSPARSKSLFTFASVAPDRPDPNGRLSATAVVNQLGTELGYRTNGSNSANTMARCTSVASVRGPASSSSSSSCSAYELSFTNLETPVRTPALNGAFDEHPSQMREGAVCPGPDRSGTFPMTQPTGSTSTSCSNAIGSDSTRIKCEEWDPRHLEPSTTAFNSDKVGSVSPTSPCGPVKQGFTGSTMDAARCDLRRDDPGNATPGRPGGESVCY